MLPKGIHIIKDEKIFDEFYLTSESPIRYENFVYFVEFDSEEKCNEWLASLLAKGLSYRVL